MMDIGRTLYVLFGRATGGRFRKEQEDTTRVSLQAGERAMNYGQPEISL